MDAGIWLGIESDYRLHLERRAQKAEDAKLQDWAKRFPYSELAKRGCVPKLTAAARSEMAGGAAVFLRRGVHRRLERQVEEDRRGVPTFAEFPKRRVRARRMA